MRIHDPDRAILILHLSDLHFGAHSRFKDQDMAALAERFFGDIEDARRKLWASDKGRRDAVDLVIATGDIAESGLPREYDQAHRFFASLVGYMGLPRERFLFTPGNHDVCWPCCRIEEQQQEGAQTCCSHG